jgi:hypothetical protein
MSTFLDRQEQPVLLLLKHHGGSIAACTPRDKLKIDVLAL